MDEASMNLPANAGELSDGYHTFDELYAHRIELWIQLCAAKRHTLPVWRSLAHSDGSEINGWFVLGMQEDEGTQMTYHLPISRWDDCTFANDLERAPEYDGHTSADVLKRLKNL